MPGGEEAEKGRIQNRIAMIDVGKSLGTLITKEDVVKKKEKEVEAAAGTRPMSMAETQKMNHDKYDKAKAEKADAVVEIVKDSLGTP